MNDLNNQMTIQLLFLEVNKGLLIGVYVCLGKIIEIVG